MDPINSWHESGRFEFLRKELSGNSLLISCRRASSRRILTTSGNPDKMSALKSFTLRDLDRRPGEVLDACDRDGAVRILRRGGKIYTVQADAGPGLISALPDFPARIARVYSQPLTRAQTRQMDKLLAGE